MSNPTISRQIWRLMIPDGAVGADEVYWDMFNASGSGCVIEVSAVRVVTVGDVAVTGELGINLHLQKSSAVGTGGTAATLQGTDPTAATFSTVSQPPGELPDGVTARLKPTGGATAGAWINQCAVFTEETNAGTYTEKWLHNTNEEIISLPPGAGLQVVQGSVASVGSVGYVVNFGVRLL
jgi:hypothetical protein